MKMSPWLRQGVVQFGIAVVEGDAAVESLVEVHLGSGEAEAAALRWNLEATTAPLHDIVVADHAGVNEAADTIQIGRCGTPGGCGFPRAASEATVVVGDEAGQYGVGRVQIRSLSQTEFAGEAILQHPPEAFDATFGLGTAGGD